MDYKKLPELDNQYPNIKNYKIGTAENTLVLYGEYATTNMVNFKIPSLDDLNWVKGTTFKFIVAIFKDIKDTAPVYYTSEDHYNNLISSINENNPYFIQASFNPKYIVKVVVNDLVTKFNSLATGELSNFVSMRQNIMFRKGGILDYDNLVTYIDWVVEKPNSLYEESNSVIPSTTLAGWDVLDGNYVTMKIGTNVSASFGIGALSKDTLDNSAKLVLAQAELKLSQLYVAKIDAEILALNTEKSTQSNFITKFHFGYSTTTVLVSDITYTSINSDNKTKRVESIIKKMNERIAILQQQKALEQTKIDAAVQTVNNLKSPSTKLPTIPDLPKIPQLPKLPKIPEIPKIPELPNLIGLAASLIPALPKLPKLPKIPSLKLPPIKLFKPKKPKVPKKFKKIGLPGMPKAPEIPKLPDAPKVPEIPKAPEIPKLLDTPKLPGG